GRGKGLHLRRSTDGGASNRHGPAATWSMAAPARTRHAQGMAAHVPSLARKTRASLVRSGSPGARPRPWLLFLIGGIGLASAAAVIGSQAAAKPLLTVASLIAA